MTRNRIPFDIVKDADNMITLIPKIKSYPKQLLKDDKLPWRGMVTLRCKFNIDNYRVEGRKVNCYGGYTSFDYDSVKFSSITIIKNNDSFEILESTVLVELDKSSFVFGNSTVGSDATNNYELVLDTKIKNEFMPASKKAGYVYLLKSEYGYKIGRSKRPKTRNNIFNVKLPFEVEMIRKVLVKDYFKAESHMHSVFSAIRMNGEWFEMKNEDVIKFDLEIEKYI